MAVSPTGDGAVMRGRSAGGGLGARGALGVRDRDDDGVDVVLLRAHCGPSTWRCRELALRWLR